MHADTRTLALTRAECLFLQRLLEFELPGEIHVVVTASLPDEQKTQDLVGLFEDFKNLHLMLTWQSTDVDRAYRQLNIDGVMRIREILAAISPNMLPTTLGRAYHKMAPAVMQAVNKALAVVTDVPVPSFSLEKPTAKA